MEIGEYVRNEGGYIAKIIDFCECEKCKERGFYEPLLDTTNFYITNLDKENNFEGLKFAKKIIDLIEVGDYVNGHLVFDIAQAPKKALYIEDNQNKMAHIPYTNEDIISILTKEQFESIKYEVK